MKVLPDETVPPPEPGWSGEAAETPPKPSQSRFSMRSVTSFGYHSEQVDKARTSIMSHARSLTQSLSKVDLKKSVQDLKDESEVMPWSTILVAMVVAALCGVCAFLFHMSVRFAGCFGGVNGCPDALLYDAISNKGELFGPSIFFICFAMLTGLICSLLLYNTEAGRECVGGGGVGTKVAVASGQRINPWVVPCRFFFASLYMGGGNTLGTEGPVIHLSITLATNIVVMMGLDRKKFISIFSVIGAAAGISAAFGVLISGFIYTIEELTRSLSRKLALILALASAVATFIKTLCDDLIHSFMHVEHSELVPHVHWEELTKNELFILILLAVPIGILNGVAGYAFTRSAVNLKRFLSRKMEDQHWLQRKLIGNKKTHLPYAGLLTGVLGAIAYNVTGINGCWGTNIDAVSHVVKTEHGSWPGALLLFVCKLVAFTVATASGGPGGMLVPSLISGGFLGLAMGEMVGGSYLFNCACAVLGMGACFSSVMCLPVTGIVIMYELTRADMLVLHVVIANFISSNVACRLPHGEHSFVHECLESNQTWKKLGKQDFIETDEQEKVAKLGAQVAEKEMMELLRETSRGMARFEERGPKVVRIVDTVTLRTTIHSPRGEVLIMVQTKKTMANGKVKVRNALPGSKQRKDEDAWTAAQRILEDDLPSLHEFVRIRRDLPLEFIDEHKVSPSYKDVMSEYQNTFVEANVYSNDPYVLARFGIFDEQDDPCTPKSIKEGGKVNNSPKFEVPTDKGEVVEFTWYCEAECQEIGVQFSGPNVRVSEPPPQPKEKKDKDSKKDSCRSMSKGTASSQVGISLTKNPNEEVYQCLRKALAGVHFLSHIDEESLDKLVMAMDEARFAATDSVITHGKTDYLYVLADGSAKMKQFAVHNVSDVRGGTPDVDHVALDVDEGSNKFLQAGAVIGEQAMFHDAHGDISVEAVTDCVFWKLNRQTFLTYVLRSDESKMKKIGPAALGKIPLFKQLSSSERQKLLDTLRVQRYAVGSYIVCQGDACDDFFILLEGNCLCTEMDVEGGSRELEEYTAGMCFGGAKFDAQGQRRSSSVMVKSNGALVLRASRKEYAKIMTTAMGTLIKGVESCEGL